MLKLQDLFNFLLTMHVLLYYTIMR